MNTPNLDEFMKGWIGMFTRSPKTKLAWKTKTSLPVPTYSTTRWWSKWEVMKHLLDAFGSFLQSEDLPPSRLKLLEILDDAPKKRKFQIELAVTIDAGEPFVKSTYRLEGDGPLIFTAYKEISSLRATITTKHYPNTDAIARSLSSTPSQYQQLINYANLCVQPAYKYFNTKFGTDLKVAVSAFKHGRYFDPVASN